MTPEEPLEAAVAREPTRRLFFALWPDEAMRQAMEHATRMAVRAAGGRPVAAANLHVTLAFLGAVPERRLPQLAEVARGAATGPAESPLELIFDRLEYWRAAGLLCALPGKPPEWTAALARRLQELLVESGFAPDRKPFRPHVTVARKIARPGPVHEMHPVVWRFTEFALVESRTLPTGPVYRVLHSFAIQ